MNKLFLIFLLGFISCKNDNATSTATEKTETITVDTSRQYTKIEKGIEPKEIVTHTIDVSIPKIAFLKDFYLSYVEEFIKIPSYEEKLIERHCTPFMQKYLKDNESDYDLFLKGQDIADGFDKSLNIVIDKDVQDGYIVTYIDPSNNSTITIKLTVIKVDGEYKINSMY